MGFPILLAAPHGEAGRLLAGRGGVPVPAEDPRGPRRRGPGAEGRSLPPGNACIRRALAAAPDHSRKSQARDTHRVLQMAAAGRGHSAGADSRVMDA